jgi:hypothetical protein
MRCFACQRARLSVRGGRHLIWNVSSLLPVQDLVTEVAAGAAARAGNHSMFKLEDIAVGSWVAYIGKERGWRIRYVSQQGFNYAGCNPGDVVSHYIRPNQARCIWAARSGTCCGGTE